jgi:hypothetical protein
VLELTERFPSHAAPAFIDVWTIDDKTYKANNTERPARFVHPPAARAALINIPPPPSSMAVF